MKEKYSYFLNPMKLQQFADEQVLLKGTEEQKKEYVWWKEYQIKNPQGSYEDFLATIHPVNKSNTKKDNTWLWIAGGVIAIGSVISLVVYFNNK